MPGGQRTSRSTSAELELSPKNQAGVLVGFATCGSVLVVGEGKYVVVAREHNVEYVQDHFALLAERSANHEL